MSWIHVCLVRFLFLSWPPLLSPPSNCWVILGDFHADSALTYFHHDRGFSCLSLFCLSLLQLHLWQKALK